MVFLLIAITACAGFLIGKLPTDQFMLLATGAFAFYFSNKGSTTVSMLKGGLTPIATVTGEGK